METIDGIAFFAIVETSIVPAEVELEDVAAAFKRLLLEVVCCAVVVVAVAVVLPAKWLTAWKVPPATPPNRTALKAMAPIFFASLAAFLFLEEGFFPLKLFCHHVLIIGFVFVIVVVSVVHHNKYFLSGICILNCVPEPASGFVCFLFCFYALQYNGNL